MSNKQKSQGEKLPMEKNIYAGFSHAQLVDMCNGKDKLITQQESDINNLLQMFITQCKLNEEWGKSMIKSGTTFFNMLHPAIKSKIPPDIAPGSMPPDLKPMTDEERKQAIKKMREDQLKNLEAEQEQKSAS